MFDFMKRLLKRNPKLKRHISIIPIRNKSEEVILLMNKHKGREYLFPLNSNVNLSVDPLEAAQGLVATAFSGVTVNANEEVQKDSFFVKTNEFLHVATIVGKDVEETVYAIKLHDVRFDSIMGKEGKVRKVQAGKVVDLVLGHFRWLVPLAISSYGGHWEVPVVKFKQQK